MLGSTSVERLPNQEVSEELQGLFKWCRKFNFITAGMHFVQFVLSLIVCIVRIRFRQSVFIQEFIRPVADGPPVLAYIPRGDWYIAYFIPAFFFVCSMDHLYVAIFNERYQHNLLRFRNPARWLEYSFSASLMMVCIGLLSGLASVSEIIMVATLSFCMNWFGWAMEEVNSVGMVNSSQSNSEYQVVWLPFAIGCVPGVIMWVATYIPFIASVEIVPSFVYGIYISILIAFNWFPLCMVYQYTGKHTSARYIRGEMAYIVSSLVAKSLLAWQVIGGTFRDSS